MYIGRTRFTCIAVVSLPSKTALVIRRVGACAKHIESIEFKPFCGVIDIKRRIAVSDTVCSARAIVYPYSGQMRVDSIRAIILNLIEKPSGGCTFTDRRRLTLQRYLHDMRVCIIFALCSRRFF